MQLLTKEQLLHSWFKFIKNESLITSNKGKPFCQIIPEDMHVIQIYIPRGLALLKILVIISDENVQITSMPKGSSC